MMKGGAELSGLDLQLKGKRALVTGGSRGVGAAAVHLLSKAGADVGIAYHNRAAEAEDVVDAARARGVRCWAEAGDLTDRNVVDRLFERVVSEFGGLDIFVGNAGVWPVADIPVSEMDDARWHRTVAVNLDSIFFTTRAALRCMSDDGRVVLVSSTAGQRGEAYHSDYAATKGAIISLVKGLCTEVGDRGITVNAVAPGWIDTEMSQNALQGEDREAIEAAIPIGRVATAEDVAGPIVLLCSDMARHITGETVNVNGGSVLAG